MIIVELGYIHQMARILVCRVLKNSQPNLEKVVLLHVFLGSAHKKTKTAHSCVLS